MEYAGLKPSHSRICKLCVVPQLKNVAVKV